jgi:hypothetical protein
MMRPAVLVWDSWRRAHMHGAGMMSMHAQDRKKRRCRKQRSVRSSIPTKSHPALSLLDLLVTCIHSVSQSRLTDWLLNHLNTGGIKPAPSPTNLTSPCTWLLVTRLFLTATCCRGLDQGLVSWWEY